MTRQEGCWSPHTRFTAASEMKDEKVKEDLGVVSGRKDFVKVKDHCRIVESKRRLMGHRMLPGEEDEGRERNDQ